MDVPARGGLADGGAMTHCPHEQFFIQDRDENADRTRTTEACTTCGKVRYGCFAKRLDDEGREAWGIVGIRTYSWAE